MPTPTAASPAERAELGKASRVEAPRSSHGEWEPPAERPDPLATLRAEDASRLPELVPLRYGRMLASAFTFYRGAAGIMAADLAGTPASGLWAQLCGDAHLSNFGGFAAPDRAIVFDVNDFDETLPGPWEWDVKRLAASFEIAGRDRGFRRRDRRAIVATAVREYREAMRRFAAMTNLDLWHMRLDLDAVIAEYGAGIDRQGRERFDRNTRKAQAKTRMRALEKLTERVDGELRIVSQPPLIEPLRDLLTPSQAVDADERVRAMLAGYRETLGEAHRHLFDGYRYLDCARKVVGVGSVGTRAWIVLLLGRDERDPLFLQIKEAEESVLEPYAAPSAFSHHGRRVVEGQRLTQAAGDILLGWMTVRGLDDLERTFYVRQLWDQKASARVDLMRPSHMTAYARLCGATLARGHARSGDRIAIGAYLGGGSVFDAALVRFADVYADRNQADFDLVAGAARDGAIEVAEPVA